MKPDDPLNVVPIEGEDGRFFVNSRSRPSMTHTVDMNYSHEGQKPKAWCFCEAFIANPKTKGKPCPHLKAVVDHIKKKRLGL